MSGNAQNQVWTGLIGNALACMFAILGIFLLGLLFIPPALICVFIGTFCAIKNRNVTSLITCIVAWILIVIAIGVSPTILLMLSLASLAGVAATSGSVGKAAPIQSPPVKEPAKTEEIRIEVAPTQPQPPVPAQAEQPPEVSM